MHGHVIQAQALDDLFKPLHAACHGLREVNVQVRPTRGDHNARQTGAGANVQNLAPLLAGHEVEDGGGVDDVTRPDAFHVARTEQAAQLALLLEHTRVFRDVGKGGAEEVTDCLRGFFWDEGVAHLATPSRPVQVLTHRRNPRAG